jgi:CRISPR-associated protein Cas2
MADRPLPHLVCYDIREPRRLRRVHQVLRRWGLPLQYSVFHVSLTHRARARLAEILRHTIDERVDDVRIYSLQTGAFITYQGRAPTAPGLFIEDLRMAPALPMSQW